MTYPARYRCYCDEFSTCFDCSEAERRKLYEVPSPRQEHERKPIVRNTSTPDGRAFWDSAERIAQQTAGWPDSKLAGINVSPLRANERPCFVMPAHSVDVKCVRNGDEAKRCHWCGEHAYSYDEMDDGVHVLRYCRECQEPGSETTPPRLVIPIHAPEPDGPEEDEPRALPQAERQRGSKFRTRQHGRR